MLELDDAEAVRVHAADVPAVGGAIGIAIRAARTGVLSARHAEPLHVKLVAVEAGQWPVRLQVAGQGLRQGLDQAPPTRISRSFAAEVEVPVGDLAVPLHTRMRGSTCAVRLESQALGSVRSALHGDANAVDPEDMHLLDVGVVGLTGGVEGGHLEIITHADGCTACDRQCRVAGGIASTRGERRAVEQQPMTGPDGGRCAGRVMTLQIVVIEHDLLGRASLDLAEVGRHLRPIEDFLVERFHDDEVVLRRQRHRGVHVSSPDRVHLDRRAEEQWSRILRRLDKACPWGRRHRRRR